MKNAFLLAIMLFTATILNSQNSQLDYKYGLKLYNLTSYEVSNRSNIACLSPSYHYTISNSVLEVLHPTISFQWKTDKNNFHEIELKDFSINQHNTLTELVNDTSSNIVSSVTSGVNSSRISAQYEYIINFNKVKDSKFVPSLGIGINPYFAHSSIHPDSDAETYPTTDTYIGVKLNLIPRITYFFSSKFFIDLNIPLCISDSYFSSNTVDNPTYPLNLRNTTTINFEQFPFCFGGRIGIGIKI